MNFKSKRRHAHTAAFSALLTLFLLFCFGVAHAQHTDFSGDWGVDQGRSDFGKFGKNSAAIEIKVVQTRDTISIERISKSGTGEIHSYVEKLSFGGDTVITMTRPTAKKTSSVNWTNSGNSLIEKSHYKDYQAIVEYNGTENWVLSGDRKTLTISRVDDGDDGHSVSKIVYEMQNQVN